MDNHVEKNIPIPTRTRVSNKTATLRTLQESGDSILVPISWRPSLFAIVSQIGFKITTRQEGDTHIRVWRL